MWTTIVVLFVAPVVLNAQKFRPDGKCGPKNGDAPCDYIPPFPTCCQKNGHCGWHCDGRPTTDKVGVAPSIVNVPRPGGVPGGGPAVPRRRPNFEVPAPTAAPKPIFESTGLYRSDGRCGPTNPLEDGTPAECDPNSEYWCCSEHGFCGGTEEHCYCDTCVNYRPVKLSSGGVRSDRRCGPDFPLEDGTPSGCDGNSINPCCSKHGYCGPGDEHCACVGCVDYRSGEGIEIPVFVGKVRTDRRCGREFPLPDGSRSECDPNGANPCCSKWGYCGPGAEHCECEECVDYRSEDQKVVQDFVGTVRTDRRCGSEFPLPGTDLPSECDPESDNFCCSKWGYCGGDDDHCGCAECVNYRNK